MGIKTQGKHHFTHMNFFDKEANSCITEVAVSDRQTSMHRVENRQTPVCPIEFRMTAVVLTQLLITPLPLVVSQFGESTTQCCLIGINYVPGLMPGLGDGEGDDVPTATPGLTPAPRGHRPGKEWGRWGWPCCWKSP